jgi:mRNA interferase RelE/StbE
MARVTLTDAAIDDLRRAGPVVAALLLGRLRALEHDPQAGIALVDQRTGYRTLDALEGDGRIVYDTDDVADTTRAVVTVRELWVDGARSDGDAYSEALERMQAADPSELVAFARIVRGLGRLTGVRAVPRHRIRQPVPDWLAEALLTGTGMSRLDVAAMDARTAFEAWNRRRPG